MSPRPDDEPTGDEPVEADRPDQDIVTTQRTTATESVTVTQTPRDEPEDTEDR